MSIAIFDFDDAASEERFLDWLCHHLYAHYAGVRRLVEEDRAPSVVVYLRPGTPFIHGRTRLSVEIHDHLIVVQDDWAAGGEPNEPRVVHEIFRDFGFSTEERALAEEREQTQLMMDEWS